MASVLTRRITKDTKDTKDTKETEDNPAEAGSHTCTREGPHD
jgi:hypothetical protein